MYYANYLNRLDSKLTRKQIIGASKWADARYAMLEKERIKRFGVGFSNPPNR